MTSIIKNAFLEVCCMHTDYHTCACKKDEDLKTFHDGFKPHVKVIMNHGAKSDTAEKSWNEDEEWKNSLASEKKEKMLKQ